MATSVLFTTAAALLAYTPALRPLVLQHARLAPPVLQFDLGKTMTKMGGNVMEKMGMGNPMDLGLTEEQGKDMEERLKTGKMSFDDFLVQVKVMQKGASMQAMLGKLGGGQVSKEQLDEGQKKMQRYSKFIEAMDIEEREDCQILIDETNRARKGAAAPRLERIAEATGRTSEDVGRFIMEFNMMRGAAVRMANGESTESIQQSMREEQMSAAGGGATMNRQQRRLAAKKGKKKAAKPAGGFGR